LVDSDGEGIEVRVRCAKDHATMGTAGTMQLAEMLAIVCRNSPAIGVSDRQHVLVWDTHTGQAHLGNRFYIVAGCRSASTVGLGKFSSAKRQANS
jgi:hypothetical protein